MTITSRAYGGAVDLTMMQTALATWIAASSDCGYMHVGDLPHRLYNGNRGRYPLNDIVHVWMYADELIGFALVYPEQHAYDVQVHPAHRATEAERAMLVWAETRCRQWMERAGADDEPILTDYVAGDTARRTLLDEMGYRVDEAPYMFVTERDLENIPDPILPDGFRIRPAKDAEHAQLAAVHSAAFDSDWTPEAYRQVMQSPGYEVERELVVVAPDGLFAAFCIYWLDHTNKVGLLEPVGTHNDFRRRGLSRAIIQRALCQMRDAGMVRALVAHEHEEDNAASAALYAAVGFTKKYSVFDCKKAPAV